MSRAIGDSSIFLSSARPGEASSREKPLLSTERAECRASVTARARPLVPHLMPRAAPDEPGEFHDRLRVTADGWFEFEELLALPKNDLPL